MNIVRVALDVPLPTLFDYRGNDVTRADIGYRVLVPFGKKLVVGVITDVVAKSEIPEHRLRPVEEVLRDVPPLAGEWIALTKFCSDYYHVPLGEVIMPALPPRLRSARPVSSASVSYVVTSAGREALTELPKRQKRVRAFLESLARRPTPESELARPGRGTRQLVKRCIDAGWIAAVAPEWPPHQFVVAHTLTS